MIANAGFPTEIRPKHVLLLIKKLYEHMANITPMRGKALIKIVKEEKVTKSGIVLPDTVEKEELERGEVIAVGEPKLDHGHAVPMQVAVGDMVILKKYGPDKLKLEGDDYCIADEEDLVGIMKK